MLFIRYQIRAAVAQASEKTSGPKHVLPNAPQIACLVDDSIPKALSYSQGDTTDLLETKQKRKKSRRKKTFL